MVQRSARDGCFSLPPWNPLAGLHSLAACAKDRTTGVVQMAGHTCIIGGLSSRSGHNRTMAQVGDVITRHKFYAENPKRGALFRPATRRPGAPTTDRGITADALRTGGLRGFLVGGAGAARATKTVTTRGLRWPRILHGANRSIRVCSLTDRWPARSSPWARRALRRSGMTTPPSCSIV